MVEHYTAMSRNELLTRDNTAAFADLLLTERNWIRKETYGLCSTESACKCRRHGFDLQAGKISSAVEQLSPCATTIEPVLF